VSGIFRLAQRFSVQGCPNPEPLLTPETIVITTLVTFLWEPATAPIKNGYLFLQQHNLLKSIILEVALNLSGWLSTGIQVKYTACGK
jgi:hypothetical protein